jgi:uncharacterized spore protein YtfJ
MERQMVSVAVVYHSGYGHTKAVAESVARGAGQAPGTKVALIPVEDAEVRMAELDAADHRTAEHFGRRVAEAAIRWSSGVAIAQAA